MAAYVFIQWIQIFLVASETILSNDWKLSFKETVNCLKKSAFISSSLVPKFPCEFAHKQEDPPHLYPHDLPGTVVVPFSLKVLAYSLKVALQGKPGVLTSQRRLFLLYILPMALLQLYQLLIQLTEKLCDIQVAAAAFWLKKVKICWSISWAMILAAFSGAGCLPWLPSGSWSWSCPSGTASGKMCSFGSEVRSLSGDPETGHIPGSRGCWSRAALEQLATSSRRSWWCWG